MFAGLSCKKFSFFHFLIEWNFIDRLLRHPTKRPCIIDVTLGYTSTVVNYHKHNDEWVTLARLYQLIWNSMYHTGQSAHKFHLNSLIFYLINIVGIRKCGLCRLEDCNYYVYCPSTPSSTFPIYLAMLRNQLCSCIEQKVKLRNPFNILHIGINRSNAISKWPIKLNRRSSTQPWL